MSKVPLYILSLHARIPKELELLVRQRKAKVCILYYDLMRCSISDWLRANVTVLDDLLEPSDYNEINSASVQQATTWHDRQELAEVLEFRGLNIGRVLEFPICNYLNTLARLKLMLTRAIEQLNPSELVAASRGWAPNDWLPTDDAPILERVAYELALERGLIFSVWSATSHIRGRLQSLLFSLRWHLRSGKRKFQIIKGILFDAFSSLTQPDHERKLTGAFVRSSHSVMEIASEFAYGGYGNSYYVGIGVDFPFFGNEYPSVRNLELFAFMPLLPSLKCKRFKRNLIQKINDASHLILTPRLGLENRLFIETFSKYLKYEGMWLFAYIYSANLILEKYRFSVVFADNSLHIIERVFFLLASRYGITTIEAAHSLCNNKFELGFPRYSLTDYYFVWGSHDRALKERLGANPDKLFEVGVGRFSNYRPAARIRTGDVIKIGITCDKEYKFHGMTGFGNLRDQTHVKRYSKLIEIAIANPKFQLSFKFRSGIESDHYLKSELRKANILNYEIVQDSNNQRWLSSLDVMITDFSTMGLEAMIFDVPVLIHHSEAVGDALGYERSESVDVIKEDLENLEKLLHSAIYQPELRRAQRAAFVESAIGTMNVEAARNTARTIAEICSNCC